MEASYFALPILITKHISEYFLAYVYIIGCAHLFIVFAYLCLCKNAQNKIDEDNDQSTNDSENLVYDSESDSDDGKFMDPDYYIDDFKDMDPDIAEKMKRRMEEETPPESDDENSILNYVYTDTVCVEKYNKLVDMYLNLKDESDNTIYALKNKSDALVACVDTEQKNYVNEYITNVNLTNKVKILTEGMLSLRDQLQNKDKDFNVFAEKIDVMMGNENIVPSTNYDELLDRIYSFVDDMVVQPADSDVVFEKMVCYQALMNGATKKQLLAATTDTDLHDLLYTRNSDKESIAQAVLLTLVRKYYSADFDDYSDIREYVNLEKHKLPMEVYKYDESGILGGPGITRDFAILRRYFEY